MQVVLAEALRQVGGLIDAIPDGVAVISRQGAIGYANHELEALTGYSRSELLKLKVENLIPTNRRARHRKQRVEYRKRPVRRPMGTDLQIDLLRKDGSELPVDIALKPLADGSGSVVIAVRDDRLRRSVEAANRRLAVVSDRERVSRRLSGEVIHELFAIGLNLQGLASEIVDEGLRIRIENAVLATDGAALRTALFEPVDNWTVERPPTNGR